MGKKVYSFSECLPDENSLGLCSLSHICAVFHPTFHTFLG